VNKASWEAEYVSRDASGVECAVDGCHGYAESVDPTPEETERLNCGRPWACCTRAFVCRRCGNRRACMAESPSFS
jgi:hypothetical protein